MAIERSIASPLDLPPVEAERLVRRIKDIYILDLSKAKPETYLPAIGEIVDVFDPKLRAAGEDFEFGREDAIELGVYIVSKTKIGENYKLFLTTFLDYDPAKMDCIYHKLPGIGITYNSTSRELVRIDKVTVTEKGKCRQSLVPRKTVFVGAADRKTFPY